MFSPRQLPTNTDRAFQLLKNNNLEEHDFSELQTLFHPKDTAQAACQLVFIDFLMGFSLVEDVKKNANKLIEKVGEKVIQLRDADVLSPSHQREASKTLTFFDEVDLSPRTPEKLTPDQRCDIQDVSINIAYHIGTSPAAFQFFEKIASELVNDLSDTKDDDLADFLNDSKPNQKTFGFLPSLSINDKPSFLIAIDAVEKVGCESICFVDTVMKRDDSILKGQLLAMVLNAGAVNMNYPEDELIKILNNTLCEFQNRNKAIEQALQVVIDVITQELVNPWFWEKNSFEKQLAAVLEAEADLKKGGDVSVILCSLKEELNLQKAILAMPDQISRVTVGRHVDIMPTNLKDLAKRIDETAGFHGVYSDQDQRRSLVIKLLGPVEQYLKQKEAEYIDKVDDHGLVFFDYNTHLTQIQDKLKSIQQLKEVLIDNLEKDVVSVISDKLEHDPCLTLNRNCSVFQSRTAQMLKIAMNQAQTFRNQ